MAPFATAVAIPGRGAFPVLPSAGAAATGRDDTGGLFAFRIVTTEPAISMTTPAASASQRAADRDRPTGGSARSRATTRLSNAYGTRPLGAWARAPLRPQAGLLAGPPLPIRGPAPLIRSRFPPLGDNKGIVRLALPPIG